MADSDTIVSLHLVIPFISMASNGHKQGSWADNGKAGGAGQWMIPLQLPIFLQQPLTELTFIKDRGFVILISLFDEMSMVKWRHDTHHNDTQHNDVQHNNK